MVPMMESLTKWLSSWVGCWPSWYKLDMEIYIGFCLLKPAASVLAGALVERGGLEACCGWGTAINGKIFVAGCFG